MRRRPRERTPRRRYAGFVPFSTEGRKRALVKALELVHRLEFGPSPPSSTMSSEDCQTLARGLEAYFFRPYETLGREEVRGVLRELRGIVRRVEET